MGELLTDRTTLRLGGPAALMLTHTDPATWSDLAHAVLGSSERPFVLGSGSNVLASDTGYAGPVIRMATHGITAQSYGDGTVDVTAQAGELLEALVGYAVAEGLSGVEYLAGIPGTVGAAPVQNTGAYGQQISDVLIGVTAYDWHQGEMVRFPSASCGFGYRTSVFKTQPGRWAVLSVTTRLHRSTRAAPIAYQPLAEALGVPTGDRPLLAEAAAAVRAHRHQRGLTLPQTGPDARQAGSVFLNPPVTGAQACAIRAAGGPVHRDQRGLVRASAGWLLQHVGYGPGHRLAPGVYCSTRRTLTLTARGNATSTRFFKVLQGLVAQVVDVTGVRLSPEPFLLGAWDHPPARQPSSR